jgi:hypothetical protein
MTEMILPPMLPLDDRDTRIEALEQENARLYQLLVDLGERHQQLIDDTRPRIRKMQRALQVVAREMQRGK